MATIGNFALPPSLMKDVKALAARDAVSVNQFLVQAAAEKAATLNARDYLAERAGRAVEGDWGRVLTKAGTPTPIPGDELPEGWPGASAGASSGSD